MLFPFVFGHTHKLTALDYLYHHKRQLLWTDDLGIHRRAPFLQLLDFNIVESCLFLEVGIF